MRMVDAERILLRGDVVAQDEIQLIVVAAAARNRRDRIMRLTVCLGEDKRILIRVAAPCAENLVRKVDETRAVCAAQADGGKRPLDDARLDIRKACKADFLFNRRLGHGEGIAPALEMVVAENRAADNRQIGIGAEEIVREQRDEVEQLAESGAVDLHRGMLAVEGDAMLVVINIGRVLQIPLRIVDGNRNGAVILPRRRIQIACIALVFMAERTLRIGRLCRVACGGNRLWVLLGL